MGLSGISFGELLLILVVLLILFGSKKLPTMARDLGTAIRGVQRAVSNIKEETQGQPQEPGQDKDGPDRRA